MGSSIILSKRTFACVIFILLVAALAFLVAKFFVLPGNLQSKGRFELASLGQNITPFENYTVGEVVGITSEQERQWPGPPTVRFTEQTLRVRMGKKWNDKDISVQYLEPGNANPRQLLKTGDRVVLGFFLNADDEKEYAVVDRYRLPLLGGLAAIFVALVIVALGIKGVGSLFGLVLSVVILLFFMLPQILLGRDPALVILTGTGFISIISALFAHGFNRKGLAGSMANFFTVLCVLGLGYASAYFLSLFGMGSESASVLQSSTLGLVNTRGVLMAAMVVGSLGALDDVTASQTAVVEELNLTTQDLSGRELFIRSMRVGREHVSALVNTLVLVYAAASLPLVLLLLLIPGQPVWVILNSESVTEEIVSILVGSLGVVLSVPISTILAVWLLKASVMSTTKDRVL